jgi:hypothetical protein
VIDVIGTLWTLANTNTFLRLQRREVKGIMGVSARRLLSKCSNSQWMMLAVVGCFFGGIYLAVRAQPHPHSLSAVAFSFFFQL